MVYLKDVMTTGSKKGFLHERKWQYDRCSFAHQNSILFVSRVGFDEFRIL